ncbi:MAG: argininosuccinate synthase [Eubacteriales bacterium]
MKNLKKEKVVLAYSGGLDTSIILTWLKEEKGLDVIAVCVDVGQKQDFNELKIKAITTGATKVYVMDAKENFISNYAFKGLKAGAVYEDDYLLGTAYARPLIAKILVEIANKEGATGIAHGATGKGNDQVRFETAIKSIAPSINIIAPWRTWDFKSREELLDYAKKHNIPIPPKKEDNYSQDDNLWHISHEGNDLENTAHAHSSKIYKKTKSLKDACEEPELISIGFEQGVPTTLNGKYLNSVELMEALNEKAGKHGIGVVDIVENRLVGMKSRGVYESPAATVLHKAHKILEKITLDKATMHYKQGIAIKYAELTYDGLWFSPLKEALDAFVEETQKYVTGSVSLELFKGNVFNKGVKSPYSLYSEELVTFDGGSGYDQSDATGFINLHSLQVCVCAQVHGKEFAHGNNENGNCEFYSFAV